MTLENMTLEKNDTKQVKKQRHFIRQKNLLPRFRPRQNLDDGLTLLAK